MFIELTDTTGLKMAVNVNHLIGFHPIDGSGNCCILLPYEEGNKVLVEESYDEIVELLRNIGSSNDTLNSY